GSRSRPSLSTDRLITDQVTSTSRTCSTCSSQREVIQAQGQAGSKNISALVRLGAAVVVMAPSSQLSAAPRAPAPGGTAYARAPCSVAEPDGRPPGGPCMPGTNLTRDEASARSLLVSTESYDVGLD